MDRIPLCQIPREVIDEAGKAIFDYVIGFVALRKNKAGEEADLGGSGTLVQIDGTRGILTAHHVLQNLPHAPEIGLVVATRRDPMPHRVTLRKEANQPVLIAKGPDCEGPDLGLLILSPADADSLSAKKSFYNLSAHREAALDHPPALNEGIWLLCGFAGELTSEYSPHRGYAKVMKFCGLYVAGWVGNEYCIGDFDYFDFEVWYGSADTPRSFGGFSGAGLWQARLTRTPDGALRTERPVLSGVAFYQTDCHTNLVETLRVVRCHARRSVYVHVPEACDGTTTLFRQAQGSLGEKGLEIKLDPFSIHISGDLIIIQGAVPDNTNGAFYYQEEQNQVYWKDSSGIQGHINRFDGRLVILDYGDPKYIPWSIEGRCRPANRIF